MLPFPTVMPMRRCIVADYSKETAGLVAQSRYRPPRGFLPNDAPARLPIIR